MQSIESGDLRVDKIHAKTQELEKAIETYKSAADLIKAKRWFGVNMMTFPAPLAFGKYMEIPDSSGLVLSAGALALGTLFSIASTREDLAKLKRETPVSCLVEIERSFKNYTSRRGGGDMNYHAWNCMEE